MQVTESHLQKTALVKLPVKDLHPGRARHWETRWLTADRKSQLLDGFVKQLYTHTTVPH